MDITNFVLFDIGRPLHVFDVKKLNGNLNIVCLNKTEKFIGLDKKEYQLEKGDIVIKDDKKIVSLAGIMGGLNSCVDENTKEVFRFHPPFLWFYTFYTDVYIIRDKL